MIHLMQSREEVYNIAQVIQENIKKIYDKRTKEDNFELGDLVLRWDSRNEYKGKHGRFDIVGYVLYSLHVCVCGCVRYDDCV